MINRVAVSTTSWPCLCLDLFLKIICFIESGCFSYPHLKLETDPKKKGLKNPVNGMQIKR